MAIWENPMMNPTFIALFAGLAWSLWGADKILEDSFPASKYGAVEASLYGAGGKEGGIHLVLEATPCRRRTFASVTPKG